VISREHNLSDVLADAGRWNEAFELESRVLPRALKVWGPEHVYVGAVRRTLGRILAQRGLDSEARASLVEAQRILTAELGESHPQVQKVEALLSKLGVTGSP
jgi:Tetratricopeptide repeat